MISKNSGSSSDATFSLNIEVPVLIVTTRTGVILTLLREKKEELSENLRLCKKSSGDTFFNDELLFTASWGKNPFP